MKTYIKIHSMMNFKMTKAQQLSVLHYFKWALCQDLKLCSLFDKVKI